MFGFSFIEWLGISLFGVVLGSFHYEMVRQKMERERRRRRREKDAIRAKEKSERLKVLRSEVLRTRYCLEAWLVRNPDLPLRHPSAQRILREHLDALCLFHETEGRWRYSYPGESVNQYDDPYWRAIWHITLMNRDTRKLPPCPFDKG